MEQNREPTINPHTYGHLIFDKGAGIYNEAKIASSINGAGKTEQLHAKNEIRKLPNAIHKDKLTVF